MATNVQSPDCPWTASHLRWDHPFLQKSYRNPKTSSELVSLLPEHGSCHLHTEERWRNPVLVTGLAALGTDILIHLCGAWPLSCIQTKPPSPWAEAEVLLRLFQDAALAREVCWSEEALEGPVPNTGVSPEEGTSRLPHLWHFTRRLQRWACLRASAASILQWIWLSAFHVCISKACSRNLRS